MQSIELPIFLGIEIFRLNNNLIKIFMVLKTSTFWETMKHPDTLAYAFWLSVSLLVLVSLLKYFISKESERKDWGYFILEFPIDVCLVVITIIITGYMKNENMPLGIIFVILSLIISIFCCIMRRFSLKYSYDEEYLKRCYACGMLDILTAAIWIFYVYSQIC